jgi:hypothetical protein
MADLPSLPQQIECLQWLELHLQEMGKRARLRQSEIDEFRRRLERAIETLQDMEYGSAIAR